MTLEGTDSLIDENRKNTTLDCMSENIHSKLRLKILDEAPRCKICFYCHQVVNFLLICDYKSFKSRSGVEEALGGGGGGGSSRWKVKNDFFRIFFH